MADPEQPTKPDPESELARALASIPDEPLLPVEKKLIAGSLLLGLMLLGLLYWLSQLLFPVVAAPP